MYTKKLGAVSSLYSCSVDVQRQVVYSGPPEVTADSCSSSKRAVVSILDYSIQFYLCSMYNIRQCLHMTTDWMVVGLNLDTTKLSLFSSIVSYFG